MNLQRRQMGLLLVFGLVLSGCTSIDTLPEDFKGPTAVIRDSGLTESSTRAKMFAVVEIDGKRVENAMSASAKASYGRGQNLTKVYPERKVAIAPTRLLLRGSHVTGAPIAAIASQLKGNFYSVEGEVEFTPVAGKMYVVKGTLDKDRSEVWVEEFGTGQRVTKVVSNP